MPCRRDRGSHHQGLYARGHEPPGDLPDGGPRGRPDPLLLDEPDVARGPLRPSRGGGLMATIRERGYHHWDGRLAERKHAWWPITRTGIVLAFRKKWFKFAFAGAFLPSAAFLAGIYISERL